MNLQLKKPKEVITFPGQLLMHHLLIQSKRWICFASIVRRMFQVCCHDQVWVRYYQNSCWLSKQGPITCYCIYQPLYALAKLVQWNCKENYDKKCVVIMMGPLYIEMADLKTIGDWLKYSGWSSALSESDIASWEAEEFFLHDSHVTKTISARQVNINIFKKNWISFEIPNMIMFQQLPSLIFMEVPSKF